jgi:hypothetical protein
VWSPEKIHEGDFICEYVGEILVRRQATETISPVLTTLCSLSLSHTHTRTRARAQTVDEAMARPDHSYQFELGIVSKSLNTDSPSSEQLRDGGADPKINVWPEAQYMVDARLKGNVARFINHSSAEPNLFAQMVFCAGCVPDMQACLPPLFSPRSVCGLVSFGALRAV